MWITRATRAQGKTMPMQGKIKGDEVKAARHVTGRALKYHTLPYSRRNELSKP